MNDPNLTATRVDLKVTSFTNEEALLKRINPDLWRIYKAMQIISSFGGAGSFEVHFFRGKIKDRNGLYIKPSFDFDGFQDQVRELNRL